MSKLPPIRNRERILIICEGYEEYDYISRLCSCGVWGNDKAIKLKNAKSISGIAGVFGYEYRSKNFDCIYVYCDTEDPPYEQFEAMVKDIEKIVDDSEITDATVYFANPCTMQIILSHFDVVSLKTPSKSANANLIERLTGVKKYVATENQRNSIMKKITASNYATMKRNIAYLPTKHTDIPGTNCLELFARLE